MPDPEQTPGPRKQDPVRLARPAVALAAVIVVQLLFASVFAGVLHHPVLHQAPVAGRSPLARSVSGNGGGTVRLAAEPTVGAAPAALSGGLSLAGADMLLVFAAVATAGLQAALGAPGTLMAVIAMVMFGDPAAGVSMATPLLASPWNVIGPGLRPPAALSAARGVVYPGGADLTRPLAVLATCAAAGTVLTLAATAWRRHRPASRAPQHAAQVAGAAADASLAS